MLRLFSALLLLALLTQSSHGLTTVYISPQGSDTVGTGEQGTPYLSLQKAITTAQGAGNLDVTVHCTPGTYYYLNNVNITVTQGTIDISPSESGECDFLLYHSSGEAFFISASGANTSIVLTNLAITGGTSYSTGGLISATDGATVVAHFVTFANGTAASNGGLVSLVNSAGSQFSNCQFLHGASTGVASGGGAVSAFNTDVTFLNCNFTGNTAERGGAVLIKNQQDAIVYAQAPTFSACVFIDNSAAPAAPNNAASSVSGGAVQIDTLFGSQSVLIIGSTFDGNKAETASGGAIFIGMGGSATTLSSIFRNHKAHIGGAIYADTSEYVSNRSDYYSNTATHINDNVSGQGGAIAINTGFVTLNTCIFEFNTAGTQGGAVAHVGGAGHLSNPLPQDQTSITGCTFAENVAINGGAFYAYGLYNLISIVNTNWIQNRATGEGLQSGGGAIFASTAPVQVSGGSFENNTAVVGMGGAMYIALAIGSTASTDFSPSVVSTHFQFNRAATGGAVCLDGLGNNTNAMGFRDTRFVQNTAVCTSCTSATGVEGYGGALMVYNTSVVVLNASFYDNFASLKGGAFFSAGEVANSATLSRTTFYGNQISEDVPTPGGLSVYVGGLTQATFFNANETIDPSQGYQFVAADNAQLTLDANVLGSIGLQDSVCSFSGLAARGNAQVYINCSMDVDNLELEDAASINLNTAESIFINKNLIWRGGGFVCSNPGLGAASNCNIYFSASGKGAASLTNSRPKYLNSCNFVSSGIVLIQNFVGAELTDLEVIGRNTPVIYSYGKMILVGDVILNNEGTTAANLQTDGGLQIESTLSLNGRSPFNFVGLNSKDSDSLSIFLQNHNATFGTTGAETSAKSTYIPTYTAFTINGDFLPQGNFQVIVPDFWKGKWNDLIKFTSRSAKFITKRLLVPNEHQSYDSYKMQVDYNSNSIDCSVKKSQSGLTGGQVFGVIFGVLLAVLLLAGLAYYFYRRQHGPATFEGEVYEKIDQPRYGTTN